MLDRGFIQAGGKSSRMGTDKAWLEIEGQPMIEHIIAAAQPTVRDLAIIINRNNGSIDLYRELAVGRKIELIYDLYDHWGPMGGIHTALDHSRNQGSSILMLACDLPFITSDFLSLMATIHRREKNDLTLPLDLSNRSQPLSAIYSPACLPVVERLLNDNRLKIDQIYQYVKTRFVSYQEYAELSGASTFLSNINSKEDYQGLRIR